MTISGAETISRPQSSWSSAGLMEEPEQQQPLVESMDTIVPTEVVDSLTISVINSGLD